ncbi:MAG: DUF362 domain-containing protein [Candidatus Hydrothermae bacterium]|nr:DUF362 domain-containing protein [Candidatus Hydrothermae bacterium]
MRLIMGVECIIYLSMKVALKRGGGREKNIRGVLELLEEELRARVKGRILLKPNLTDHKRSPANTSPETLEVILEFLSDFDEIEVIHIGDGSGGAFFSGKSTWDVVREMGYEALKRYPKVELVNLDELPHPIEIEVRTVRGPATIRVAELNYDFIASVAIPKTHDFVIYTGALKNMMGAIHPEDRIKVHGLTMDDLPYLESRSPVPVWLKKFLRGILPAGLFAKMAWHERVYLASVRKIHSNLFAFLKVLRPDFAIIDGFWGMEGNGPVNGAPYLHDFAVASFDPLAADALAVRLMGFSPEEVGYLKLLAEAKIGALEGEPLGDALEGLERKYRPHRLYYLQKLWKKLHP